MNELPWSERVPTISINPDMATRDDIARMAAELMEAKAENARLAADIKDLQSFNNDLCADLCAIEDALGLKLDQHNEDGSWKPTREAVKEKLRDLIARGGELGDLLAPTIELLERLSRQIPEKPDYWSACGQCERNSEDTKDELARLRALTPERPPKKSSCAPTTKGV